MLNVVRSMAKRNGMIIESDRSDGSSDGNAHQQHNAIDRAARGVLERWLCRNVPPGEIEELAKAAEEALGTDSGAARAARGALSTVQKAINKLKSPQLKRLCRILGLENVRQIVHEMKAAIKAYAVDKDELEMLDNIKLAQKEPAPAPAQPAPPPLPAQQSAAPAALAQQPAAPEALIDPQLQAFLLQAAQNPTLFQQVLQQVQHQQEQQQEQQQHQ